MTVEELWFRYLALGGNTGLLELEGFLHGLMPLDPLEEDMLAHAINERLAESYNAARIPYLRNAVAAVEGDGPPTVLSGVLSTDQHRCVPARRCAGRAARGGRVAGGACRGTGRP